MDIVLKEVILSFEIQEEWKGSSGKEKETGCFNPICFFLFGLLLILF